MSKIESTSEYGQEEFSMYNFCLFLTDCEILDENFMSSVKKNWLTKEELSKWWKNTIDEEYDFEEYFSIFLIYD